MRQADPPGFTDARALARWPGSPPELVRRFTRGGPRAPRRPEPHAPDSPRPAASSASKPSSPHEAVLATSGLPGASRPLLSWASPLQSLPPAEPRTLHDPAPFPSTPLARRSGTRSPRASTAPREGATLSQQVRPLRPRGRVDLVGAPTRGATASRTVPPLGGSPASLDLGATCVERVARGPRRCEGLDQRPTSVR